MAEPTVKAQAPAPTPAPAPEPAPALAPAPSSYIPHPADVVGNAFASQYYTILQQSPALVYRFYQDNSKLGRPRDDGTMGFTSTMDAINAKIQSYGSLKADIKFVDAQESYNKGVLVVVTGSLIGADELKRDFTQTFFLAPQDKGFFVLNDILRYVEDGSHQNQRQNGSIAPTAPIQEEALPVKENHINAESNGEVYNPHENGVLPAKEVEVEEEPVAEVVDEVSTVPQAAVESNVKVEVESNVTVPDELSNDSQAPKKSYASIVMKDTPVSAPIPNPSKSAPKAQEQQMPVKAAPVKSAPVAANSPSSADVVDDGNNHEPEGEGHSIYIKNLPFNVPYVVVEEAFKSFGPIKSGSIQIRKNNSFSFGFVEFEVAGAARSAIEASPIKIAGRDVVVEEKKSTGSRALSSAGPIRGRFPSGRGGGGYKGDGGRGHGGYGGGRGYGRGESNRNDFGNRGGGRGYHNRSEGFQRNDQNGNGAGRVIRGGGSGIKSTRAQVIPGV